MKKLAIWALLVTFVVAGSAFAAPGKVTANATFDFGGPATTNNDDSCDISVAPAATLLLPYFEVDLAGAGAGETTVFTITNVSADPQVAHVTLWTDWSYPVIDFNIFLTGYDVQSINLYDVIGRGQIAPTTGTGDDVSHYSDASNDPTAAQASTCVNLPVTLPTAYKTRMQNAFTEGFVGALGSLAGCDTVGGTHANAIGYATVDVADACTTSLPTDPSYFATEIAYDNVLIGDYAQVNSAEDFAQGNPMVHIRAIPEGGGDTNLPRTFYERYSGGTDDRQPLPAIFAARWISGGATGFETYYKIWREGVTGSDAACDEYPVNGELGITEIVRFDEEENYTTQAPDIVVSPPLENAAVLPETSMTNVDNADVFPENPGDVGGWMYLNLDNDNTDEIASQNWVVVSMRAEGRYSVDFDAAWLGNGCTGPVDQSTLTTGNFVIGPAPNDTGYYYPVPPIN